MNKKSDLETEENELISDMVDGQDPDAQIQNVLFNKTGKLVPRSTTRHITKFHMRMVVNDSDLKEMFNGKERRELSVTQYIMTYCR